MQIKKIVQRPRKEGTSAAHDTCYVVILRLIIDKLKLM